MLSPVDLMQRDHGEVVGNPRSLWSLADPRDPGMEAGSKCVISSPDSLVASGLTVGVEEKSSSHTSFQFRAEDGSARKRCLPLSQIPGT